MIKFKSTLLKFGEQGEKTGWTYLVVPAKVANKLNPGVRTSYRVKGLLDELAVERIALIPMGEGDFIIPFNAAMRKGTGKRKGAEVSLQLMLDTSEFVPSAELMECLNDEPKALATFKAMNKSNQNYFTKWIDSAKTDETKAKRIAQAVNGLAKGYNYSAMIRALKADKEMLK